MKTSVFPGSEETKAAVFDYLLSKKDLTEGDRKDFDKNPVKYLGGTLHLAVNRVTEILKETHQLKPKGKPMAKKTTKTDKPADDAAPKKSSFQGNEVFEPTGDVSKMRKGIGIEIVEMFDGKAKLNAVIKKAEKKLAEKVKSAKFTDDPAAYVHKHVRRALDGGALKAV